MSRVTLLIPADHPAYDGHFPGAPVLPGAVLLDAVLEALDDGVPRSWRISAVKFSGVVRPGEPLELEYEILPDGAVRFSVVSGLRTVASGMLTSS